MPFPVYGSETFANVPDVNGTLVLLNGGNTPQISAGFYASIPAAGNAGNLYITTDTNVIYRDNGTAWVLLYGIGIGNVGTVTTSTYAVGTADYYLGVNYSGAGSCAITLGTGVQGRQLLIKDEGGNASAHHINLIGTVDGTTNLVISSNKSSATLIYRGTSWWIV